MDIKGFQHSSNYFYLLLQIFFRSYYEPDTERFRDEAAVVDKLANKLMVSFNTKIIRLATY